VFSLILACTLTGPVTPAGLVDYLECREIQEQIIVVEQHIPLVTEIFHPDNHLQALRVIYCESRGNPNAVGINTDKSKDIGLWQFNDRTWNWLKPKLKITSSRVNPRVSTLVANWLVENDGWHHWNASKHCWDS